MSTVELTDEAMSLAHKKLYGATCQLLRSSTKPFGGRVRATTYGASWMSSLLGM